MSAGLSESEVAERVARGQSNAVDTGTSRSYADIVRTNVLTRINLIYFVLFVIVLSTGHLLDGLFALLIVVNSVVGMVQEVRAKRTLDRLAVVNRARVRVIRAEGEREIEPGGIVLDDIVFVRSGDQVPVDGVVVSADALEVDESLLTGESDPVLPAEGDRVLSGSVVVAGSARLRATAVGQEAYASRLAKEASVFRAPVSQLRGGIDRILTYVTWLLVPVGVLTVLNQLFGGSQDLPDALRGMVAALVPMVPEGLVLMTSVALAVGVIRLGRRNCLVQDLPAIEALARVDTVCADKTGTLTEDGMRVLRRESFSSVPAERVDALVAAFGVAEANPNASLVALLEANPDVAAAPAVRAVPFSSARKWSALVTDDATWVLGAPDVLLAAGAASARAAELGGEGLRILALTRTDADVADVPAGCEPVALFVLEQRVRAEAPGAIAYFAEQGVDVKVISGDAPDAVGVVARSVGVPGAERVVDARALPSDASELADVVTEAAVFGRVTPEQKRGMVRALQSRDRTVAMTGDGVNDVLALKYADVGIAMGSGSPATRAVARIVLLDNSFATLPAVVAEGRRVIGNIERVATLFLTKTLYSILLALLIAVTMVPFPFLPRHITLVAWFTIGIPAFFLALAPNTERARDGFVSRVLSAAIPGGLGVAGASYGAYLVARAVIGDSQAHQVVTSTTALGALVLVAFGVLVSVARPFRPWKAVLVGAMFLGMAVVMFTPVGQSVFQLDPTDLRVWLIAVPAAAAGLALRWVSSSAVRAFVARRPRPS